LALAQGHSTRDFVGSGIITGVDFALPAAGHEQAKRVEWLPDLDSNQD
jgi:hypothetical protein